MILLHFAVEDSVLDIKPNNFAAKTWCNKKKQCDRMRDRLQMLGAMEAAELEIAQREPLGKQTRTPPYTKFQSLAKRML